MKTRITQVQLIELLNAQQALAAANKVAKEAEAACEAAEKPICQALLRGDPIERGPMTAALSRSERRVVAWKKVVEEKLGIEEAVRITNATEPRVYHHVVVSMQEVKR